MTRQLAILVLFLLPQATLYSEQAESICNEAQFVGGLIVHAGCGNGELTAALGGSGRLVCGLERDLASVNAARQHILSQEKYGSVSIAHWKGDGLPFANSTVNLLVIGDNVSIPSDELKRVLAPNGCAHEEAQGVFFRNRPDERLDEWSHYLYDSTNNAVSNDSQVGHPKHLRWKAGPLWARSHDLTPSFSAMVSAHGTVVHITDEGVIGFGHETLPDRWSLIARDAYNGIQLWKKPFPNWGARMWAGKGHWDTPMTLPRRMVAAGDRVFVTLGYRAPISVLDIRTGETIKTLSQTDNADEFIYSAGLIIVRRRDHLPDSPHVKAWSVHSARRGKEESTKTKPSVHKGETVMTISAETGEILWSQREQRLATLSLAANDEVVCYHTFDELVCLDLKSGESKWRVPNQTKADLREIGGTLVIYKDMVFWNTNVELEARSIATGELVWKAPKLIRIAVRHPADLLICNDILWTGMTEAIASGTLPNDGTTVELQPHDGFQTLGLDYRTGKAKRTVVVDQLVSKGHHVRCYRSKATNRFLFWPKRGVELVDITTGTDHMRYDWLRGECSYGIMPSNGLLYVPPHPCACYMGVAVNGFHACSPQANANRSNSGSVLEQGPAYGTVKITDDVALNPHEWPMYRHDAGRSGGIVQTVSAKVTRKWTADVGGQLTPPIIAGGKLFVVSKDQHALHALDAATGRISWSHIAGGPVDSPPTYSSGLLFMGCRDGSVSCLDADTGETVWRFRAAPSNRQIVAMGRLESPWPVSGSVLIEKETLYFAAGRSTYLDGGIYVFGLDPLTGKVKYDVQLSGPWPDAKSEVGAAYDMRGTKADLLVSNGEGIYMLNQKFTYELKAIPQTQSQEDGPASGKPRLIATAGFLDDTYFHRTHWAYTSYHPGTAFGFSPRSGLLVVFDEDKTYGYNHFTRLQGHNPILGDKNGPYVLTADDITNSKTRPMNQWGYKRTAPPKWTINIALRIRAMVLAGENLFVAGPAGALPVEDPYRELDGRGGAYLKVVSAKTGETLNSLQLPAVPVFDGMVAVKDRIFISDTAGTVSCFHGMSSGHLPVHASN